MNLEALVKLQRKMTDLIQLKSKWYVKLTEGRSLKHKIKKGKRWKTKEEES